MKYLVLAVVLASTIVARSQVPSTPPPDDKNKPKPFAPIVARQHTGDGRIGVRLVFMKDGTCLIGGLVRGGPAFDAGFHVGDVIVKIDKNYVSTLNADDARLALHGEPGTGVELTVMRDNSPHYFVRATERRVLPDDVEEMAQPPVSEVAPVPGPITDVGPAK